MKQLRKKKWQRSDRPRCWRRHGQGSRENPEPLPVLIPGRKEPEAEVEKSETEAVAAPGIENGTK